MLIAFLLACTEPPDTDPVEDTDVDCPTDVVTLAGTLRNGQTDDRVAGATLAVHMDQDPAGTVDAVITTDAAGAWTFDAPPCDAFTLVLEGVPDEWPQGIWPDLVPGATDLDLHAMDEMTWTLLPSLLGVSPDPALSMVLGTVRDEDGAPLAGVTVAALEGDTPVGYPHYFVDEFPNRDATQTSADGLFVLFDAPAGEFALVALDGGAEVARIYAVGEGSAVVYTQLSAGGPAWPEDCPAACRD